MLKVYWNSTFTKYTQNNSGNWIKSKNVYILNESPDQINFKKQSRKYLHNCQCLAALKNFIAKLFALVTVAISIPWTLFPSKNPVAVGKDLRRIKHWDILKDVISSKENIASSIVFFWDKIF